MENVPIENSKGLKRSKKIQGRRQQIQLAAAKPDDLDWSYMLNRNSLIMIAKASCIANFCKKQHLQYIVHMTRLGNDSLQKKLLLDCKKNYACYSNAEKNHTIVRII